MSLVSSDVGPKTRPVTLEDFERVVDFMLHIYPSLRRERRIAEKYYRWKYFDLEGRDTGYPSAFMAEDAQGVCAFLGCLPFLLQYNGSRTAAGWIADWHQLDRVRGHGLGRALLRSAIKLVPSVACLGATEPAEKVFAQHGLTICQKAQVWHRVDSPFSYEWRRRSGWRKTFGIVRGFQHWLKRRVNNSDDEVDSIRLEKAISPAHIDATWLTLNSNGMVRHSGYLAWLTRCPTTQVTCYPLIKSDDNTIGYAIIQVIRDRYGCRRARIIDLYFVPSESILEAQVLNVIYRHLVKALAADYVEVLSSASISSQYRQARFKCVRSYSLWWKSECKELNSMRPDGHRDWVLSLADKDNAFRDCGPIP